MKEKEWADKIAGWLEEVIKNSNKPLDEHWDTEMVEEEKAIIIKASNPKTLFDVFIIVENGFATLNIYTGIETAVIDNQERLKIYRDLLLLSNKWKMVKYVLEGDEDEIVIKTDLDLSSFGKEEFNDALTVTLFALHDLMRKLELEEEYEEEQLEHVIEIIEEKMESGENRQDIVKYLMETFDISKDRAEEILRRIMDEKSLDYIR